MIKRILVLGASGFVGQHVLRALRSSGGLVPVVARHRTTLAADPAVRQLQLDARDEAALARALSDVDGVVNCVAGSADTIARSGRALFAASASVPSRPRIVYLSSMAVYGSQAGDVTEAAPMLADVGAYSAAKAEVERVAAGSSNVVILRPGCIYGPGSSQWSVRIAKWLIAHRVGDLGAGGDGFSNLVYVDDVVAAIIAALGNEDAGGRTYNLAAQPRVRWNEYFTVFAKALGAVPLSRIGRRRLQLETRLLAPGLKIASILAGRLRLGTEWIPEPIPPSLARLWTQEIHLDSSRAERELGVAWTPLARGLEETLAWLGRSPGRGFR